MKYQFMRFPEGKLKAVTLSYDDGVPSDARFSEVITSYGFKCTFNMNGDGMRGASALSKETVESIVFARGHELALHGYYHAAPGRVRAAIGIRDVLENRIEMERKYGRIIRGMAYPDAGTNILENGMTYERIKDYLIDLDVAYARTTRSHGGFALPNDFHAWCPTAHHNDPKLFEYIEKFLSFEYTGWGKISSAAPMLFYLWGHSYEFDRDSNWDRLDKIGEALGGKDDVYYATNIEIYDYVKAYNSLVYSLDGTMIYNPTLYTLWFVRDGSDPISIKSGETLKF